MVVMFHGFVLEEQVSVCGFISVATSSAHVKGDLYGT
jgi:hypothetical protein